MFTSINHHSIGCTHQYTFNNRVTCALFSYFFRTKYCNYLLTTVFNTNRIRSNDLWWVIYPDKNVLSQPQHIHIYYRNMALTLSLSQVTQRTNCCCTEKSIFSFRSATGPNAATARWAAGLSKIHTCLAASKAPGLSVFQRKRWGSVLWRPLHFTVLELLCFFTHPQVPVPRTDLCHL